MKIIAAFVLGIVVGLIPWFYAAVGEPRSPLSSSQEVGELPYQKYAFERLARGQSVSDRIEVGRELQGGEGYSSQMFYYFSEGKRISGQLNVPLTGNSAKMPVIVMARGYADKEGYTTGLGTRNAAAYYASHGYVTVSPDFLGYGESDPENEDALGARLAKPVSILDLIASLESLPQVDGDRIYLWGHSNGGQIMLSVAEILGKRGTPIKGLTLWAPVSKPFPYNVLYYSDEADDKGRWLRSEVAKFEAYYDATHYSIDHYFTWIQIPIQLHQGTADPEVPRLWSDELRDELEKVGVTVTYSVYPGADHNLAGAWNTVVARDVEFFRSLD